MPKTKLKMHSTKSSRTEIVAVDFVEIDDIRLWVRRWIKDYKKRNPKSPVSQIKGNWTSCPFYIGRGVRNITFIDLSLPYFGVRQLAKELERRYSEYYVYINRNTPHNLKLYLHGKPKYERR